MLKGGDTLCPVSVNGGQAGANQHLLQRRMVCCGMCPTPGVLLTAKIHIRANPRD